MKLTHWLMGAAALAAAFGPLEAAARPGGVAIPNRVQVEQVGSGNGAAVVQTGADNSARIQQNGAGNIATVAQNGSRNRACIRQRGNGHVAEVVQNGDDQRTSVYQAGNIQRQAQGSLIFGRMLIRCE